MHKACLQAVKVKRLTKKCLWRIEQHLAELLTLDPTSTGPGKDLLSWDPGSATLPGAAQRAVSGLFAA